MRNSLGLTKDEVAEQLQVLADVAAAAQTTVDVFDDRHIMGLPHVTSLTTEADFRYTFYEDLGGVFEAVTDAQLRHADTVYGDAVALSRLYAEDHAYEPGQAQAHLAGLARAESL